MTISNTFRKRLRRYALFCLMAASTAGFIESSQRSFAEDTHDSGDLCGWLEEQSITTFSRESVAARNQTPHTPAPQILTADVDDELIIDTCNYGTWLAETVQAETHAPRSAPRTASGFNSTIATIAAAASAGNPVPISHWTEPFAMVGPDGSHTSKEVEAFQAWFDKGKAFVAGLTSNALDDFVPVVDFSGEVPGPEAESVVEVEVDSEVVVTEPASLVGSSPVIATIKSPVIASINETYLPYDLAESDLDALNQAQQERDEHEDPAPVSDVSVPVEPPQLVWADGLFSPSRQPFCIRALDLAWEPGWSPLARYVDAAVNQPEIDADSFVAETVDENVSVAPTESIVQSATQPVDLTPNSVEPESIEMANCLLHAMVWQVNVAWEDARRNDLRLRPKRIGKNLASLVVSGDRIASQVASELALVWPAPAKPAKPIPGSGAKLLARAEAAEQLPAEDSTESFTPEQLAQAGAIVGQWVDVAQSVIDEVAIRLNDVTEVARNRGTQDDSNRR